jgi:hypothetical protein
MNTWTVTLKTGSKTWSTITVEADTHVAAVKSAQRLLGSFPVTCVV